MKTTLIVIQNDADHAQAKAPVAKLMDSRHSADRMRMVAQALLIEAYERTPVAAQVTGGPGGSLDLFDGSARPFTR